jgi:hypothetical protein
MLSALRLNVILIITSMLNVIRLSVVEPTMFYFCRSMFKPGSNIIKLFIIKLGEKGLPGTNTYYEITLITKICNLRT